MINKISKTTITKRTGKKRNPEIMETINLAKKNNLLDLAKKLSAPRSQYKNINLDELSKVEGDKILVVGKILGSGEISRKIGVAALGFSQSAKESLNKAGCDLKSVRTAIEKNPKMEGVTVIG
jgi:large subunit ribosomal protein L18e